MTKQANNNKVALFGFGLILLVVVITFVKPALDRNSKQENDLSEPVGTYSDYEYITAKELQEKIGEQEELTIIDIRDSVSYKQEHVEGSINITPEKIEKEMNKINKDGLTVVVGYNFEDKNAEAGAVKFLKDYGLNNVVALSGGIFAWKTSANSTVRLGDPESSIDVSKIEYILPEQVKLAIDNDYPTFIIDTRSNNLFSQGHIPKAVNIPFEDLEQRRKEIPSTKEIIVYGESDLIDFQSGVKLHDLGFLANYIIKGGYKSWQEKRFPLAK